MRTLECVTVLAAGALTLTGCGPAAEASGDPLPAAVELPSAESGVHVEFVAEVDGNAYYVVDEGEASMCIVQYRSAEDWTAGCGGPSIRMTHKGTTVAWFESGTTLDAEWSHIGGGLWMIS